MSAGHISKAMKFYKSYPVKYRVWGIMIVVVVITYILR